MSDWNNKHIPSDLDSMTAKDLRELVLIQIEHGQQSAKENANLREELNSVKHENISLRSGVKGDLLRRYKEAQQRAEKAEAERDALKERHLNLAMYHAVDPQQAGQSAKESIGKFAIEQQIKGIEDAVAKAPSKANYRLPLIETTDLHDYCEQLRKELEK